MKPIPTWEERYTNCSLETAMRAEIDALRQRCAELEAEQNICGSGAGCLSKEARIDAAEERCVELERDAAPTQVLAEHSGCGHGTQIDQLTVRLNPGDKVVLVMGAYSAAIASVPKGE